MTVCQLVEIELLPDGRARRRCRRCGWQTVTARGRLVNRRCGPPAAQRAGNALAAAGRLAKAAVTRQPIQVGAAEQARRLAICQACEHFAGDLCRLCGCVGSWKARLATEACPASPPRW